MLAANLPDRTVSWPGRFGIEELYSFSRETSGGEDLGLDNEEIVFMRESERTSSGPRPKALASPRSALM